MASRERPADRGARLGRASVIRLGSEIRLARIDRGLSIDDAASGARLSNAEVSRIERGLSPRVPFVTLSRLASVAGLDLSARLYPGSGPVRDHAHAELLGDLRSIIHPSLSWDLEVPLPIPGDQRAWDALLRGQDWRFGVEAETAPSDGQGLVRRLRLKLRDGGVDGVLLAVRDTERVRRFLVDARLELDSIFTQRSREAIAALRQAQRPSGNAIVIVPRRRLSGR